MKQRHMPLGYRMAGGKILIVPEQAELVKEVFQAYSEGNSLYQLARRLTIMGRSMQTISRSGTMGQLEKSWRTESIWETNSIQPLWNRNCSTRYRSAEKKKVRSWDASCSPTALGNAPCSQIVWSVESVVSPTAGMWNTAASRERKSVWKCKHYINGNRVYCRKCVPGRTARTLS